MVTPLIRTFHGCFLHSMGIHLTFHFKKATEKRKGPHFCFVPFNMANGTKSNGQMGLIENGYLIPQMCFLPFSFIATFYSAHSSTLLFSVFLAQFGPSLQNKFPVYSREWRLFSLQP